MIEMIYTWTVQDSTHKPHEALSTGNLASANDELI